MAYPSKKEHLDWITVRGAKTHNLKDIDVKIPRGKIIVFTGLSGSGKSSLAFDTIFAEGQRRYIESLSAYARQFLSKVQKPDVEEITGLSPAIAIDQKSRSNNPRSTVSTITEINDYLRVLYARVGKVTCVLCDRPIVKSSKSQIIITLSKKIKTEGWIKKYSKSKLSNCKLKILAPIVMGRKGEYYSLLYTLLGRGYEYVFVDGKKKALRQKLILDRNKKHSISVLIDEIQMHDFVSKPKETYERLSESIERALHEANDILEIIYPDGTKALTSAKFFCPHDGFSFPELEPRLFSFNSPYGACQECNGLGFEDPMFYDTVCKACNGSRLRPEALHVKLKSKNGELNMSETTALSVINFFDFFSNLVLNKTEESIAEPLINEIISRASFLVDVGLDYLTLDRRAYTLSGGEAQRIRLASQLGSGLVGALYVLDEPTIGLHQRDNKRLIQTLKNLRDAGNTIIVVEHDQDTIYASDFLVDVGPGAGINGGEIVVAGFLDNLLSAKYNISKSSTLSYLREEKYIPIPKKRRNLSMGNLKIKKIKINNISGMDISIPLGKMTTITGVSGSGKSTILHDVLYKNLKYKLERGRNAREIFNAESISGTENLQRSVFVDQSPIGRTPRSTPVTYTGTFSHIRDIFASTEQARYHGWKAGRFSFNVDGGRCENCSGNGVVAVEMHFLPTVYVICDVCRGKRYSKETLAVTYKKKSIYDVLSMSVDEAYKFFKDIPSIKDRLKTLSDVGLGYIKLGQSSTTLSGGEAQRVKISSELYRPHTKQTIYLLDEPTVGLHYDDVKKLLRILNRLLDRGNTVVLIEHNMDVIKCSDHILDIGPEGGTHGGKLVSKGTPEYIASQDTHTGIFLKKVLKRKFYE